MNKFFTIILLSLFSFAAAAQSYTVSRYPVYERSPEYTRDCRDVVVENRMNPGGAIVGAAIGYALGRELDRGYHHRGYVIPIPHRGYVGGRGAYYRDGYYVQPGYNSRAGRVGGAVTGAVIGGNVGYGGRTVTRVCEESRFSRDILTGHRVVERHSDGRTVEYFEPVR